MRRRPLLLACAIALLSSCSSNDAIDNAPNLYSVQPAVLPNTELEVPVVDLTEIEAYYRQALAVAERPDTRRKILIRLAGLEMAKSERNLAEAETSQPFFGDAITMYQELIELQREQPEGVATQVDELLYQLSKAYALDGRTSEADATLAELATTYPGSPFLAEANFRRAEQSFTEEDYRISSERYEAVVAAGPKSEFYENALYMLGWSQFKRGVYEDALDSFTQLLDVYLQDGTDISTLTGSAKTLCEDTLRVMSLSFSYLEGPASITATYQRLGARPYEHLLYANLAELYLAKQRFSDSADTYQAFVDLYPLDDRAPGFTAAKIKVYEVGGFPELLVPTKAQFIELYGINSAYWAARDEAGREPLLPTLHLYLTELAQYRHARAQQWQQALKEKPKQKLVVDNQPINAQVINNEYLLAAGWYREFVQTFPDDPDTGQMTYLLAEALYAANQKEAAFSEFHRVAYSLREQLPDQKLGAEAGYTTVILAEELLAKATLDDERNYWQEQAIYTGLLFADLYGTDPRAVAVLTRSAQGLLKTGQPERAVEAASRVTQWQPQPESELLVTAWLIVAQAEFNRSNYSQAEYAYTQVLQRLPANDSRRPQINERLAASIYKRADQAVARGDLNDAVDQLLRVKALLPNSDIARTAHFDAANYLMELGRWQEAKGLLQSFKQAYPKDPLTASIGAKMVVIHQALEEWSQAAEALLAEMKRDPDPEFRRQSTLLVAELYERDGKQSEALAQYRDYANRYPEPFSENLEAQYKLTELYRDAGERDKRNFWLKKIMSSHDHAGRQQSARSSYLAAWAGSDLADQQYRTFAAIKLRLPLKNSLKSKKAALESTLKAYEKTLSYNIQEFTTQANFRIGEIYAELSRDLMDSERPKGLSELELEQYEILLEEQALPFEDQAIEIHAANSERSWIGVYDDWVKSSFEALAKLLPGRYAKPEQSVEASSEIY
ncbi:tetratricopeptide repeat protein [Halioxenophilus sp. WMMB6]|uniref:tetratricopeptide repeat protein n=1 Tax=Halioxenophilus sp. WMMB6 TaxID=3073815 RepID=UPI00295E534F|nr:tetratricopeptide repeat protein [Halioxenophilus sp. WMMB6]